MRPHIIDSVLTELREIEQRVSSLWHQLERQADDALSDMCHKHVGNVHAEVTQAIAHLTPKPVEAVVETAAAEPVEESPEATVGPITEPAADQKSSDEASAD